MHRLFLILFLIFIANTCIAAVFVVTSNADSGPGTLREALTLAAANGSTEKDYINFNLPGISADARTILIATSLPLITSNLVIDGSTQNGAVFGQSDARVKVSTLYQSYDDNKITVFEAQNATNVEIYGLYIYDFTDIVISRPAIVQRNGLKFTNCNNITIGVANKGNLIRGFKLYSLDFENVDHITLQATVIGITQFNKIGNEGEDAGSYDAASGLINFISCDHILLGGDMNQGNTIFTGINLQFTELSNVTVSIKSNNFLVYKDGVSTINTLAEFYRPLIMVSTILTNEIQNDEQARTVEASVNMDVSNNLSGSSIELFHFNLVAGTSSFTNNFFNVARDGSTSIGYNQRIDPYQIPIVIDNCKGQFNIGTNDKNKRNLFYNIQQGVRVSGDPNVFLRYNDFKCVSEFAYKNQVFAIQYTLPVIIITSISNNGPNTRVNGTATPNATIDIYSSESCQAQCSIRSYIQTVTADNSGKWQTDILNLNGIFYASATLNNQTSEFKTFQVNADNVKVNPLRCNNMGTITGLVVPSGISYYWINESGTKVSDDLDLKTSNPGKYQLVLGSGCITSDLFEITDDRIIIDAGSLTKTDISCGTNNGSIKNIFVFDPENKIKAIEWYDTNGKPVGNTTNIDGLPTGKYTLKVFTTDGCEADYGPVTLISTTGPNIDDSKPDIANTNCGQSAGSIKNIIVTGGSGTRHFIWKNELQQEVAYTQDLTGQPGGKYTLHVTDDTQCGEVVSSTFEIKIDGAIILDERAKIIQPATCEFNNGGVKGVTATGATIYKWYNTDNQVISNKPDLENVAPGSYYLVASNSNGCSTQSSIYTIERLPRTIIGNTKTIKNATCGENNGSITIIFQQQPAPTPESFRWVNHATGANVAITTGPELKGLDAGTYDIYVTEQGGCEYQMASYIVYRVEGLSVTTDNVQVEDDHCRAGTGSIRGINVNGATPLTFVWTDDNNKVVGNAPNLENLNAGTYHIQITDGSGCMQGLVYTVYDKPEVVAPPSVTDLDLCTAGNTLLVVNDAAGEYSYRLYDNADSATPLNEEQNGRFAVNVAGDRSYYVSKLKGNCESARVEIKIKVGISALNIANTFTPNGDGHNDYWKIDGVENYPQAVVQIFNRNGQKLFESKGYTQPFNGSYNGKPLPFGTYFYIINLNKNCNLLSGSLTIIR